MSSPRIALVVLAASLFLPQLTAQAPSGYTLMYEDNFSSSHVDEAAWEYRDDHRKVGTWVDGYDVPSAVTQHDGALHITARPETINGEKRFLGGGLISRHQFGYGYYECLSKPFMAGKGVHSAFWLANGYVPNNNILEIDSYEIDSTSTMGTNNLYLHIPSPDGVEPAWPLRSSAPWEPRQDGWFLDAFEWTPDGIDFYDNGVLHAHVDYRDFPAAQRIWLTALNGITPVDESVQPADTVFRYVRYYARDFPGRNLLPNGDFEYNQHSGETVSPIAWTPRGPSGKTYVERGTSAHSGQFFLRMQAAQGALQQTASQTLEFLLDGDYLFSGWYRTSGSSPHAAVSAAADSDTAKSTQLGPSATWKRFVLPVTVHGHRITLTLSGSGTQDASVQFDRVQFYKPLHGTEEADEHAYRIWDDPVWKTASTLPIHFIGDESFIMLDRNVGAGDHFSVTLSLAPDSLQHSTPIERWAREDGLGWALSLTEDGGIDLHLGSVLHHTTLHAANAYAPHTFARITATYDRGHLSLFRDGKRLAESTLPSPPSPANRAIGKLGNTGDDFAAVGDIALSTGKHTSSSSRFHGTLYDVRIYNRAITAQELAQLPVKPSSAPNTWVTP